jgi:4-alpha-glucanotransferase
MYVVQFAQRLNPQAALAKLPPRSVASLNTHDMPTFAAHVQGLDITDRRTLGLFTKAEALKEHAHRAELTSASLEFLEHHGWLKHTDGDLLDQLLHACLGWLCASPAELVLINLEDLWREEFPQNVPGTSTERPNWRRKARLSIEEIRNNAEFADVLRNLGRTGYTK